MTFRRVALPLALAACCLAHSPGRAAPLYRVQRLPDRGQGSFARAAGELGPLSVAVGDVNGDTVDAALWIANGNRWQLHPLSDLGYGGSAVALTDQSSPRLLIGGTVRDASGVDHAAVWTVQRTARGWRDTLLVLDSTAGERSEVAGFTGGDIDHPTVVGSREAAEGALVYHTIIWELMANGTVQATPLPGLGGMNARAVAGGLALPGGSLRIPGNAQLPGSSVDLACEWRGPDPQSLTALLLPAVSPDTESQQLLAADPLLRFAVGREQIPGVSRGAAWATFPTSSGDWSPLPPAIQPAGAPDLASVNSSGRAIEASDDWESPVTLRIHVPQSEARPLLVNALCTNEAFAASSSRGLAAEAVQFNDLLVSSITDRNLITGAGVGGGPHRAVVLIPRGVDGADYLALAEGEATTPVTEPALFYIDDIIIGLRGSTPDTWLGLKLNIDIAHTVQRRLALSVTARVEGPRTDGARQVVCLWNFALNKYDEVSPATLRGGRFQTLKHRLPSNLSPYLSSHGDLHLSLRWNGAGFRHTGEGYSVQVNAATLGSG